MVALYGFFMIYSSEPWMLFLFTLEVCTLKLGYLEISDKHEVDNYDTVLNPRANATLGLES